jgi:hypothetical protein
MTCDRRLPVHARRTFRIGTLGLLSLMCSCGSEDSLPFLTSPPVVVALTPLVATVQVGDTTRFAAAISGGSPNGPPTVVSCTLASARTATVTASPTGCTVVGVLPGTTEVIVFASTGHQATSSVVVVPR